MKHIDTLELCSVAYHASQMGQDAHAAYWCERTNPESSEFLRSAVFEHLTKIAGIYGMKLVESGQ